MRGDLRAQTQLLPHDFGETEADVCVCVVPPLLSKCSHYNDALRC